MIHKDNVIECKKKYIFSVPIHIKVLSPLIRRNLRVFSYSTFLLTFVCILALLFVTISFYVSVKSEIVEKDQWFFSISMGLGRWRAADLRSSDCRGPLLTRCHRVACCFYYLCLKALAVTTLRSRILRQIAHLLFHSTALNKLL